MREVGVDHSLHDLGKGGGGKSKGYSGGSLTSPIDRGVAHNVTPPKGYSGGGNTGVDTGVFNASSPRSQVQYLKSHLHGKTDGGTDKHHH